MHRFIASLALILFLAVCAYLFTLWAERRKAPINQKRHDVHRATGCVVPFQKSGTIFVVRPHTSYLDGPAVARWLTKDRQIQHAVFAVDPDFARHRFWRFVLNVYGRLVGGHTMVALDSSRPFALRQLLKVLQHGGHVVIFPQGTGISAGSKRADQPGFLWMTAKTQAKIINCHLKHSKKWPVVEQPRYMSAANAIVEGKKPYS